MQTQRVQSERIQPAEAVSLPLTSPHCDQSYSIQTDKSNQSHKCYLKVKSEARKGLPEQKRTCGNIPQSHELRGKLYTPPRMSAFLRLADSICHLVDCAD